MATTYYNTVYSTGGVAATVFTRGLNTNWDAISSSFSGTSYQSTPIAGMLHMRTGGTGDGLRLRNAGGTAWEKVLTGDADQIMWAGRNDTPEGWLQNTSITDRVCAFYGGTNAYSTYGDQGTWTQPTHNHGGDTGTSDDNTISNVVAGTQFAEDSHKHSISGDRTPTTWRPAARVGRAIYPDLT